MGKTAKLEYDGKTLELPLITGTENEGAVDIAQLRAKSGLITLDDGYANTGACASKITFLDGEKGILRYRGYPIDQLAEKSDFVETSYLLIFGELPTKSQYDAFNTSITRHSLIHEDLIHFFDNYPSTAHPMAILSSMVCSLSCYYPHSMDPDNKHERELDMIRLLSKMRTIAAYTYKKSIGQPVMYPMNNLSYCANFLYMMFALPAEPYEIDPDWVRALNLLLILHADHEQNCSTSTVRLVGSSYANLYATIASGVCALWGPRHGGANQAVIEMLQQMKDSKESPKVFLDKVKDKNSGERLMGFGHRVYKNYDPRAKIIKQMCHRVLNKRQIKDPLLDIAMELEEIALKDSYFVDRKLYPNVDFYSGIIYRAMGFPLNMFTVMFALGRIPGWLAHWKEMIEDPKMRISRPRQVYTGANERNYTPIDQRG